MAKNNFTDYAGYCDYYTSGDFIAHFGILGMKWGVRRYQNPDGSLTPEGLKRYSYNSGLGEYEKRNRNSRKQLEKMENFEKYAYNPTDAEKLRSLNLVGMDEKTKVYELKNREELKKAGFRMQATGNGFKKVDNKTYFTVGAYRRSGDDSAFNLKNYNEYMAHKDAIDKNTEKQFNEYVNTLKDIYVDLKDKNKYHINPTKTYASGGLENKLTYYRNIFYGDYTIEISATYDMETSETSKWTAYHQ